MIDEKEVRKKHRAEKRGVLLQLHGQKDSSFKKMSKS
jgi:hypothetical protein